MLYILQKCLQATVPRNGRTRENPSASCSYFMSLVLWIRLHKHMSEVNMLRAQRCAIIQSYHIQRGASTLKSSIVKKLPSLMMCRHARICVLRSEILVQCAGCLPFVSERSLFCSRGGRKLYVHTFRGCDQVRLQTGS